MGLVGLWGNASVNEHVSAAQRSIMVTLSSQSFPLMSQPDGTAQCHTEVLALVKKQDSCADS